MNKAKEEFVRAAAELKAADEKRRESNEEYQKWGKICDEAQKVYATALASYAKECGIPESSLSLGYVRTNELP